MKPVAVENVSNWTQNAPVENETHGSQAIIQNVRNCAQTAPTSKGQARPLTKDETSPKGTQSVIMNEIGVGIRNLLELLEQWVLLSACISV